MSLEPLFSLSPRNPSYSGYDSSSPSSPYANAVFFTMGGFIQHSGYLALENQYHQDEIIIGFDAVDPSNENLGAPEDTLKKNIISIGWEAKHVDEGKQF